MSIIHSALKKAEGEQQKRLEPYQISVEEILALAEKNPPAQPPRRKLEGRIWNLRWLAKSAGVLGIALLVAGSHYLSFRLIQSQQFFNVSWRNGSENHERRPVLSSPLVSSTTSEKTASVQIAHTPVQTVPSRSVSAPIENLTSWPESKEFHLTGVAASGGRWTAVLNNRLVEVGDLILGAQVVAIEERRVFLERRGKRFVVSFAP